MNKNQKLTSYIGCRKCNDKFTGQIRVNNKRIHLGTFETEKDAGFAYDNYVIKNNLNRRLNFPDAEPENLIPNTRLIRLTKGKFAIVDEEDFEWLNQWNWITFGNKKNIYAARGIRINGKCITILMHHAILGKSDLFTDHKNGNGLHNYKSNLRLCTRLENQRNRKIQKGQSKYKGVFPIRNKFRSRIRINKKGVHLGYFDNEIEAAKAYDTAAKEHFGEFARTNF